MAWRSSGGQQALQILSLPPQWVQRLQVHASTLCRVCVCVTVFIFLEEIASLDDILMFLIYKDHAQVISTVPASLISPLPLGRSSSFYDPNSSPILGYTRPVKYALNFPNKQYC